MKSLVAGLTDTQNLTGIGLGFRTVKEFLDCKLEFSHLYQNEEDGMQRIGHRVHLIFCTHCNGTVQHDAWRIA